MDSDSAAYKLPFIDFSNQELKAGSPDWEILKFQVRKALEEYGCFEASYDKVSANLSSDVVTSVQELFSLSLPIKLRNASKKPYHGYVGQYPHVPLYESMGIDGATLLDKVETFTTTLWPQGNPDFSKTIQMYSELVSNLDKIVRKMIVQSFGLEEYVDEHLESTDYLLRVMKYKGPQTPETELGLTSHTDKNIVTILHQNEVEGLEVQTKEGTWIKIQPSPTSFIVMIGDSLNAWLNGRLHSPFHRVMMSGNEARYSLGLFSIPKAGYIIKAPLEMVDDQHPLLFKPFDHADFLSFYYSAAGQRAPSALNAYCGISS
ncbi:Probable 2-oxoglutarate-dependent dioxygenase AOP1.2 [Linum grandiflorum]